MPHRKAGAYDEFDSFDEARDWYKRCRRQQSFILSDAGAAKLDPVCAHCGKKLSELPPDHPDLNRGYIGNRCVYDPKRKKIVVWHYICSWESLINQVFKMAEHLY